jgi:alcohol dehydrogenase class IV
LRRRQTRIGTGVVNAHCIDEAAMNLKGNWNYPTAIRFGAGRISELPEACRTLGIHRPLIVTDPGLAKLAMIADAVRLCTDAGLGAAVFSDMQANPVEENVTRGVALFRKGNHDGVVAFGGGSALDVGKSIALMSGQTRPIFDFEDREDWYTRVNVDGMAPVIAVPTTAGTGSEVGRASVITDIADHTKKIIFHPRMMPAIVIEDPQLTVGLPPQVTAATGMDALSHCLEAYCAPSYHPMAEGIAVEGMRLIKEWLPVAVREGANLQARSNMLIASTMGATAFQKGLGAMHSLSHPCGANLNTHHGLTNAVVMPYVLAWNRKAIDEKLARLAAWLGLENHSFDGVLEWVLSLRRTIGIPNTLTDIGVRTEHAAAFAPQAFADPSTGGNPLPLNAKQFEQLYLNCLRGELAAPP